MKHHFLFPLLLSFISLNCLAEEPSSRTVKETFKDWAVICVEQAGNKQCEAKQTLVNQDNNVVAVITVVIKEKNKILQLTLPHLLDLTKLVKISVDSKASMIFPFKFCNRAACFVLIDDDKIFNAFKKGTVGVISVKALGSPKNLDLNFSLRGFSAALKSLNAS